MSTEQSLTSVCVGIYSTSMACAVISLTYGLMTTENLLWALRMRIAELDRERRLLVAVDGRMDRYEATTQRLNIHRIAEAWLSG